MIASEDFVEFYEQFDRLRVVVEESNNRSLAEPGDPLFQKYLNVFVKSYLVSACSVLEALVQSIAHRYAGIMRERIGQINIPRNIVYWGVTGNEKLKDPRFESFAINISDDDISDLISGNIFKTIKTFASLGVNLESNETFNGFKDYISAIVEKRNNIVHHNDNASDISFSDILYALEQFKDYSNTIIEVVQNCPHLVNPAHLGNAAPIILA